MLRSLSSISFSGKTFSTGHWWYRSIIPALRILRQEAFESKASLDYPENSKSALTIQ